MSWFSDFTSKAEAMLVKLDQDAAQVLQNPDTLFEGTKLSEQPTSSNIDTDQSQITKIIEDTEEEPPKGTDELLSLRANESSRKLNENSSNIVSQFHNQAIPKQSTSDSANNDVNQVEFQEQKIDHVNNTSATSYDDVPKTISETGELDSTPPPPTSTTTSRYSKKFKIQNSRSGFKPFVPDNNKLNVKKKSRVTSGANKTIAEQDQETGDSLGANDIRASINRSLQEYANKSSPYSNNNNLNHSPYSSHFDHQPNLIQYSPPSLDDNAARLQSSSFSINLPDDNHDDQSGGFFGSSDEIAMKLLKQNALKKKSTFYLHKVINSIANPNGQSNAIFDNQMAIRIRRVQLRVASYARRLNNYYRANPKLKYFIIGYLILMQLLVVYVLFFYNQSSSSSSNDLSSQIKQQQRELNSS